MPLISQSDLARPAPVRPAWHGAVLDDLASRLTPPSDFPCTFSQNAFRRGLLLFSFVDGTGPADLAAMRADLADYVALSRGWNGRINTAHPLVMAFSPAAVGATGLAGHHAFGWRMLQHWHDHDPAPWPDDVARDPGLPFWSMCFAGMQLFVNMSSPAHARRHSRNLGRHLLFIVNPRERFDAVAGDTPEGARVRQVIRDRAVAHDGMAHAPVLGKYLHGQLEWPQYALPDDNDTAPATCPFRQRDPA